MKKSKSKKRGSITNFIESKLLPVIGRFGNQRHLSAIRDGFALIMPIVLAGAVATLWTSVLFYKTGGKSSLTGLIYHLAGIADVNWKLSTTAPHYKEIFEYAKAMSFIFIQLQVAAYNYIAVWATMGVSYMMLKNKGANNPFIGTMILTAAWLLTTDVLSSPGVWMDAKGLLAGLAVALIGGELYGKLEKSEKLKIKMPNGVPPMIGKSFSALLPGAITLATFAFVNWSFWAGFTYSHIAVTHLPGHKGMWTFTGAIYYGVMSPFLSAFSTKSAQLGLMITYVLLVRTLWWFGLHGSNVAAGIFSPILTVFLTENNAAVTAGKTPENIFVGSTFTSYIFLSTLGLLIASWIFSKTKDRIQLNKIATVPKIFNIGEPLMYGFPVVLNVFFVIPFIFTEVVLSIITYFSISLGFINAPMAEVPWTTPPFISGLISSGFDYKTILVSAVTLVSAILMYSPFVFLENKSLVAKAKADEKINAKLAEESV